MRDPDHLLYERTECIHKQSGHAYASVSQSTRFITNYVSPNIAAAGHSCKYMYSTEWNENQDQ